MHSWQLQLSVRNCSHRFSLQTSIWSLWRILTHINFQIRTIHMIILSMGMASFHPFAHRCFPKTRSLQPRSSLLTGLLNMASQSNHHQSLQLPQEEQKSPTKGRDRVSIVTKSYCSFGQTILKKLKAKIAAKPRRKSASPWTTDNV